MITDHESSYPATSHLQAEPERPWQTVAGCLMLVAALALLCIVL